MNIFSRKKKNKDSSSNDKADTKTDDVNDNVEKDEDLENKNNDNNNNNDDNDNKEEKKDSVRTLNVVVIDGDRFHNWPSIFKTSKNTHLKDGSILHIYQGSWNKMSIVTYPEGPRLHLAPSHESEEKIIDPLTTTIEPHFVLVRNQPRGALPVTDCRNVLYGLMMGNVPSINTLTSIYLCLERPIMLSALKAIENRVGYDNFPVINAIYYSGNKEMIIAPEMPAVIKVSHAHAGMGKIKVSDQTGFQDVSTIIALNDDYCTCESFIEPEYGIRVQKIGNKYRVMKKYFTGSGWKSHFGGAMLIEDKLEDKYKLWADECAKSFGGLDILAVDAIHGKDGKDYIIELNDTAIGILAEKWEEDSLYLSDMVVQKLNSIYK